MKRYLMTLLLGAVVLAGGCLKDTVKESYTFYRPVYRTRDEVKNNIKSSAAMPIAQPGKIVVKGHYLFLNEVDKGIHVIDIANPAQPVNTAFIAIPGNVDLMINGNYLYADCYTDLVTLDVTNPASVSVKQFTEGVFPHRFYSNYRPDTTKVIANWIRVDTVLSRDFDQKFSDLAPGGGLVFFSPLASSLYSSSATGYTSGGSAIAGSMARFAMQNDRLYTVTNDDLKVFNATTPQAPVFVRMLNLLEGNIETIFPYKNKLFIGSMNGMYIYDASNPDQPSKTGKFTHARTCDPVIADDNFAYVTLSGGTFCGGFSNQLDVINISNLANPTLVKSYPLTGPKGLSKDGNLLVICDGKSGLKFFDASAPAAVAPLQTITGFNPVDVIAVNGLAITVAKEGIFLVDYSVPGNASVAGKITVSQTK